MQTNNPTLMSIGGRQYRFIQPTDREIQGGSSRIAEKETEDYVPYTEDECCDIDADYVIERQGNMYSAKMAVPKDFLKFIIGKRGATKQKIERDTSTSIIVPRQTDLNDTPVGLFEWGQSERSVSSACTRIDIIMGEAFNTLDFTHFLSIPLIDPSLRDSFRKVQEMLKTSNEYATLPGMHPSILTDPDKMHITLVMLKLFDQQSINTAIDLMKSLQPIVYDLVGSRSLILRYCGVDIMNDDPSSAHVLYARLVEDEAAQCLRKIRENIANAFRSSGLVDIKDMDRPFKPHVTLINTKKREVVNCDRMYSRQPVDVSNIISNLADYEFGVGRIPNIQLSRRDSVGENGFYLAEFSLVLP